VAPTDEEARELATSGMMGRCWREFLLPLYLKLGLGKLLKVDAAMPDEAIDLDYLAKHLWLVGSPTTVARRIQELQAGSGGFGRLMIVSYDATDERDAWERSLELLARQVLPLCNDSPEMGRLITKCGHELRRPRH
jgi:alkanesulfonate monooxygenase SsuD/methylene tetrahydromethanopterin reductase-like flavin-dependent oxidoreductase (luciferase family)